MGDIVVSKLNKPTDPKMAEIADLTLKTLQLAAEKALARAFANRPDRSFLAFVNPRPLRAYRLIRLKVTAYRHVKRLPSLRSANALIS